MKRKDIAKGFILLSFLTLVGCSSSTNETNLEWFKDDNEHWHSVVEEGKWVRVDRTRHHMVNNDEKFIDATCISGGTKFEICSICGYETSSAIPAKSHTYIVDPTSGTPATCLSTGIKVSKCSECGEEKEDVIPYSDHVYGAPQTVTTTSTATGYSKSVCNWCDKTEIRISALDYIAVGSSSTTAFGNKDTTTTGNNGKAETLKMSANGNFVDYKINLSDGFTGTAYLYGWVDRFSENSTKSFFSGNKVSTTGADKNGNFSLAINGNTTTITNTKTYAEMGMTASGIYVTDANYVSTSSDQSAYERANAILCEVGSITLTAGTNTIRYTRIDSYNLNLIDFVFIGTSED